MLASRPRAGVQRPDRWEAGLKVLLRGPTRAELEERTRELRLQRWRRRPVAALVTAALAAGCVMPAAAVAEPGGWDGGDGLELALVAGVELVVFVELGQR